MNELLHINNDEQIKSVESATVEEVCGYIGDLFLDRLGCLARKWQEFEKLTEEEREIKKVKYHKYQQMNSRRVEVGFLL